jgi:hypothetical protein
MSVSFCCNQAVRFQAFGGWRHFDCRRCWLQVPGTGLRFFVLVATIVVLFELARLWNYDLVVVLERSGSY